MKQPIIGPPSGDGAPRTAKFDVPQPERDTALVNPQRFLLATRDTGYRGVSSAVAELVDNALQAHSRCIRLLIDDDPSSPGTLRVGVLDDGRGMKPAELGVALQFGGSQRFDDRGGIGRFGMGLPNSSVSQARRVDVYSWTDEREVYRCTLDLDEVAAGEARLAEPSRASLPAWAAGSAAAHGTLVVWSKCDRLAFRRATALASRLSSEIGRLFRYALWDGVKIEVGGKPVRPRDPLLLRVERGGVRSRPFGAEMRYEVRLPGSAATSLIRVRFSELPVSVWQARPVEERRRAGVIGGGGVSIVRAGREIDHGWHLMGRKRRENYDDWWRCEIAFDPPLDEMFGVTHSKQGIRPSPELVGLLAPDLESVARNLNRRVRNSFIGLAAPAQSIAERTASRKERLLPPVSGSATSNRSDITETTDYRIEVQNLASGDFFQLEHSCGVRRLILNRHHPFFNRVYEPLSGHDDARFGLECLLLSAARALETGSASPVTPLTVVRTNWSDALAAFLT